MAQCFAIFEGGGAKGLAHVGALKAAESRNLEFIGVAGASAGAIIAALVAGAGQGGRPFLSQSSEARNLVVRGARLDRTITTGPLAQVPGV
jgi:NTE family protein